MTNASLIDEKWPFPPTRRVKSLLSSGKWEAGTQQRRALGRKRRLLMNRSSGWLITPLRGNSWKPIRCYLIHGRRRALSQSYFHATNKRLSSKIAHHLTSVILFGEDNIVESCRAQGELGCAAFGFVCLIHVLISERSSRFLWRHKVSKLRKAERLPNGIATSGVASQFVAH